MTHLSMLQKNLQEVNRDSHEQSVLTELRDDVFVKGARWVTRQSLSEAEIGWPIYYNAATDKILLTPLSHVMIDGSTGTGKSTVLIQNTVNFMASLREDQKPFLYISDFNGLLTPILLGHLEANGYETHVFDMRNVTRSLRYNPLSKIYDDHHRVLALRERLQSEELSDGEKQDICCEILLLEDRRDKTVTSIAHVLVPPIPGDKAPNWQDGARMMVVGGIWVMIKDSERPEVSGITRDKFTIHTLVQIMTATQDDCSSLISYFERYESVSNEVKTAVSGYLRLNARQTRDSYVSSCINALSVFQSRRIQLLTAESDVDMKALARGEKPHAVMVITDDRNPEMNQILALIVTELINTFLDVAVECPGQRLSRPALFLLDELCNTPALESLTRNITTTRGRNIFFCCAIQSYEQLHRLYPNEDETILDNCDLSVFLGTNNVASLEKFARLFGEHSVVRASFSMAGDLSVNRSLVTETVPLLHKSDLEGLALGTFYARHRRCGNFLCRMTPYFLREDVDHTPCALPLISREPMEMLERPTFDIDEVLETEYQIKQQEKRKASRPSRFWDDRDFLRDLRDSDELFSPRPLTKDPELRVDEDEVDGDGDGTVDGDDGDGDRKTDPTPLASEYEDARSTEDDRESTEEELRDLERKLDEMEEEPDDCPEDGIAVPEDMDSMDDEDFDSFFERFMKDIMGSRGQSDSDSPKEDKKPTDT